MGAQTHNILKRYLEDEYGRMRSLQHFLLVSYGVLDWFSLDLKGGAGNIKQHPVGSDEVDYPSAFAGGYGFRIKFYDNRKIRMVLGFQHISVHPKEIKLGPTEYSGVLDDWQWSLLASRNLGKVTPYLGAKFSRTDYIHWIGDDRKRKQSDLTKELGLVLGCDFDINQRAWVNLEGQLFDIEAVALSFNFSF